MQPDTSLYSNTADKLRALALCIEAQIEGKMIEYIKQDDPDDTWEPCEARIVGAYVDEFDFRVAARQPAEVWSVINAETGEMYGLFTTQEEATEYAQGRNSVRIDRFREVL